MPGILYWLQLFMRFSIWALTVSSETKRVAALATLPNAENILTSSTRKAVQKFSSLKLGISSSKS